MPDTDERGPDPEYGRVLEQVSKVYFGIGWGCVVIAALLLVSFLIFPSASWWIFFAIVGVGLGGTVAALQYSKYDQLAYFYIRGNENES